MMTILKPDGEVTSTTLVIVMLIHGHVVNIVCQSTSNPEPEDLKPLCNHPSTQRVATLDAFPAPEYLFQWYVRTSQPVLFKGVLENIHYPAYTKWTDQYLKEKYGHLLVETEEPKLGYRNPDNVKTRLLKEVLDDYQTKDIYMIQQVMEQMKDEVLVPSSMHCGGFQHVITKVYIWLNSGNTKGVLHYDDVDNINCLLDGSKDLKLISRQYQERVEADHFDKERGYSAANVTHLDLQQFPALRDIPWVQVHMDKGDCMFIPNGWYHQVNSYGDRNLAINIWFRELPWFNRTDCEEGHSWGDMLSEYTEISDLHRIRLSLLSQFKHLNELNKQHLHLLTPDGDVDTAAKMFKLMDSNEDEIVSWEEVMTFDVSGFLEKLKDLLEPEEEEN